MANVASRYARALFEYGMGEGADAADRNASLLGAFASEWERSEALRRVLLSPGIGKPKKMQFLADVFQAKSERAFLSFLRVLVEKDRIGLVPRINAEYGALALASRDSARALIESAYPLDDAAVARITETFRKKGNLRDLLPTVRVNDKLIGGIRVTIGSETYDGTIRSALDRLLGTMTIQG
jgi:F-type H+-transporting ATPase subunit delta